MSRSDPLPDLVYNGVAYRLADGASADLEARGVITPGVEGEARYGLSLEHDFGEVAPFITAAAPPRETPRFPRLRRLLGFAGRVYDNWAWDPELERRQRILFPRRTRRDR